MADRRSEESPVAPRRSLAGKADKPDAPESGSSTPRPSVTERVAAVVQASKTPSSATSVTSAKPAESAKPATSVKPVKRVRRARLRLTHIDPWSVMKTSFLLSIALGIVTVVAVGIVWSVLGAAGVFESIDKTVGDVVGENGRSFQIEDYIGMSRVMGFTLIIAVVDVILVTVVATLGAFLYNLAAALLGGLEVVLAEDER